MVDCLCTHGWGPGKEYQGKKKIKMEEWEVKGREDGGVRKNRRRRGRKRRIIRSKLSTFSSKILSQMVTSAQMLEKAAHV